jgi:hypothetical protein
MKTTILNLNIPEHSSLKEFYRHAREFQHDVIPFISHYVCFEWKVSPGGVDYGVTTLGLDSLNQGFDFTHSLWVSEEIDGNFELESSFGFFEKRTNVTLNNQQKNLIDSFYAVVPEMRELCELDNYIQKDGSKILIEKNSHTMLFFDGHNTVEI